MEKSKSRKKRQIERKSVEEKLIDVNSFISKEIEKVDSDKDLDSTMLELTSDHLVALGDKNETKISAMTLGNLRQLIRSVVQEELKKKVNRE